MVDQRVIKPLYPSIIINLVGYSILLNRINWYLTIEVLPSNVLPKYFKIIEEAKLGIVKVQLW